MVTLCAPEDYSTTQLDEISQIIGISLQSEKELNNPKIHSCPSRQHMEISQSIFQQKCHIYPPAVSWHPECSASTLHACLQSTTCSDCVKVKSICTEGRRESRCLIPILLQKASWGLSPPLWLAWQGEQCHTRYHTYCTFNCCTCTEWAHFSKWDILEKHFASRDSSYNNYS